MLTVVPDVAGTLPADGQPSSLIDQIVRDGARQMLAAALRAEVAAYVDQFGGLRDENGRRLVVRNGTAEPRTVVTSAGAVEVTAPRVNDRRTDPETGQRMRFSSAILPPWARKTPQVSEVLPLLYLHGLSSGDFVPALGQFPRRRARMWLDARWRRPTMARRREWGSSLCSFPGRIVVDQVITGNPEGRGGCAVP
jgi:Transposase, Mutator family